MKKIVNFIIFNIFLLIFVMPVMVFADETIDFSDTHTEKIITYNGNSKLVIFIPKEGKIKNIIMHFHGNGGDAIGSADFNAVSEGIKNYDYKNTVVFYPAQGIAGDNINTESKNKSTADALYTEYEKFCNENNIKNPNLIITQYSGSFVATKQFITKLSNQKYHFFLIDSAAPNYYYEQGEIEWKNIIDLFILNANYLYNNSFKQVIKKFKTANSEGYSVQIKLKSGSHGDADNQTFRYLPYLLGNEKVSDNITTALKNEYLFYDADLKNVTDETEIDNIIKKMEGLYASESEDVDYPDSMGGVQFNPENPRLKYDSLCANKGIRDVVRIIGYVISICKWVVPFIIMVLGMLDFVKAVVENDEKALGKATSSLIKRFVAGVIVILIPTIALGILKAVKITNGIEDEEDSNFGACTICLFKPSECGEGVEINNDVGGKPTNNGTTNTEDDNDTESSKVNPNKVNYKHFSVANLKCKIYYKSTPITGFTFDYRKGEEMLSILNQVCEYTNRSQYISRLQTAGFAVDRPDSGYDYHSKGLAVDLNNNWSYTYKGKTYYPYQNQGPDTWNNYKNFICEVCKGDATCPQNINYHIYVDYFQKYDGWCWGGTWNPQYFDPMHIEYSKYTSTNCGKVTTHIDCN